MNKREKILAILVGAFVVLFIGRSVVKSFFLDPLSEKDRQIESAEKEIQKRQAKLDTRNRLIRTWRNYDQRSLDRDPTKAFLTLNARITNIINSSGLKEGVSVKPVPINMKKGNGVDWYWPIAVNLSARGTLDQIVKFMEMVYQEPYNLKVTGLTIRPEGKNGTLAISNCRIESIVPAKPVSPGITEKPLPEITATQPVIKLLPDSQYAMISKNNIFAPAPPPPPPPPVVVKPQPATIPQAQAMTPVSSGPGRPGDVIGTFAVGKQYGAYVRNQTEVQWYKVGERLTNNMELTFVHPLGIVFLDPSGQSKYAEIGQNINQAQMLSLQAIPELYQAYQAAKSADEKN
jgi:hypothetical protein